MNRAAPIVLAAATALMALGMGTRSAFGLFVSPLNTATGIGLAGLGFAMAMGQLAHGVVQPLLGWMADRYGVRRLVVSGAAMVALATVSVGAASSVASMTVVMVTMAIAGSAVASSSLLLAEVGRSVSVERCAFAFGVVSAGGSVGQLILGPLTQTALATLGWMGALWATALLGLVAVPLAYAFRGANVDHSSATAPAAKNELGDVLRSAPFWLIALSFGICGFHVSFLTAHMPGVIERCGLDPKLAGPWLALLGTANLAGSLGVGMWLRRHSTQVVMMSIFGLRAASIVLLLVLPVDPLVMLIFGALMGVSYMSLLPAISQQVAERYGTLRMATIFGIVSLVHQVGSFAGIWLGGVMAQATGRDTALWTIDIGLALLAIGLQLRLARADAGWRPAMRLAVAAS
jgi:MFS family permease